MNCRSGMRKGFCFGMNKKKLTVFLKVQLILDLHKLKTPGKNSMDKWEDCEHALTTKSTKGEQKERAARRSQGRSSLAGREGDVKNKVCSYGKNCLWAKEDLSSPNTERALEFHFQVRLHRSSVEESFSLPQGQEACQSQALLTCSRHQEWQLCNCPDKLRACPWTNLSFHSLSCFILIRMDDSTTSERRKDFFSCFVMSS